MFDSLVWKTFLHCAYNFIFSSAKKPARLKIIPFLYTQVFRKVHKSHKHEFGNME